LLLVLAVLAVRPLVLESHIDDENRFSSALRTSYYVAGAAADRPDGAQFARVLSFTPKSIEPFVCEVPAEGTALGYAVTPPGVPGRDRWETGHWTITVPVVEPHPAVRLTVGVSCLTLEGARAAYYAEPAQALVEPGLYTFELPAIGWPAGAVSDRIGIVYRFENSASSSASVTLQTGGTDARITTPGMYVPSRSGPQLTVLFNGAILFAALLEALAVARTGRWSYRWTGAEIGVLLLLVGLIVSTFLAGNRRLAVVAACDFACLLLLMLLLTQLLRRPWQVRLTLCVIVATGCVAAFRCLQQVGEFGETITQYRQAGGAGGDDAVSRLFRSRLEAREPTAYMAHPNIAGGYLMLAAFAAAGLAAAKFTARHEPLRRLFATLTAAGAIFIVVGMRLTGSRGAALAALGAAGLMIVAALLRHHFHRHRRRYLIAAWSCVAAGAIVTAFLSRSAERLPIGSVAFRLQYWSTAWPMIRENPLGVGSDHFGQHYLAHKPVISPDEIKNAHNLFVHAAAEWGFIGLCGLIALLIGISRVLITPRDARRDDSHSAGHVMRYALVLTLTVLAARVYVSIGTNPAYVVLAAVIPALVFVLAFVLAAIDRDRLDRFDDDTMGISLWFLGAGLIAFGVHNLISFSLFIPGASTPFFALIAVALAVRYRNLDDRAKSEPGSRVVSFVPLTLTFTLSTVYLFWVARPVSASARHLATARHAMHYGALPADPHAHPAHRHFADATAADPLDPVPPSAWARWLAEYPYTDPATAEARLDEAAQWMRTAIDRDPIDVNHHRRLASILAESFRRTGNSQALHDAVTAAAAVTTGYPESPQDHLNLAELYDQLAGVTADRSTAERAADAYRRALELDGDRPGQVELRRFSESVRRRTEERLRAVQASLSPTDR
jgi:hypothetical protein